MVGVKSKASGFKNTIDMIIADMDDNHTERHNGHDNIFVMKL